MRLLLFLFCIVLCADSNAQETNTSIGFLLSPNFSNVHYSKVSAEDQMDLEEAQTNTTGVIGLSGSSFFQYKLTDKLFVTWGLGAQNYRHTRTYSTEDETFTSKKAYSQYYLQIQAAVKYRIFRALYVRAGLGVDLLLEAHYRASDSFSDGYYHKGNDSSKFKGAMVPISLGAGYELKLTDRVNLVAELFGTVVTTNALDITPNSFVLQRKPWQLGTSIGVIRSF